MTICRYCGNTEAPADTECCAACLDPMREAYALLLAGLAELFRAAREQQAAEKEVAA